MNYHIRCLLETIAKAIVVTITVIVVIVEIIFNTSLAIEKWKFYRKVNTEEVRK